MKWSLLKHLLIVCAIYVLLRKTRENSEDSLCWITMMNMLATSAILMNILGKKYDDPFHKRLFSSFLEDERNSEVKEKYIFLINFTYLGPFCSTIVLLPGH